jgi:prepilin-type N-terminal cleavage/methylation domain-containing protein
MTRLSKQFHRRVPCTAFSLVELVMVVIIIGIIAAIAVPRMTSASKSAEAQALAATLADVRKAIDCYYAEHGKYPGYNPDTGAPDGDRFLKQLAMYTDGAGNTSGAPGYPYIYGPYLRRPFPRNPFNGLDTVSVRKDPASAAPAAGSVGWVATLSNGAFDISAAAQSLQELDKLTKVDLAGGS